jgi:hypothetical protein
VFIYEEWLHWPSVGIANPRNLTTISETWRNSTFLRGVVHIQPRVSNYIFFEFSHML